MALSHQKTVEESNIAAANGLSVFSMNQKGNSTPVDEPSPALGFGLQMRKTMTMQPKPKPVLVEDTKLSTFLMDVIDTVCEEAQAPPLPKRIERGKTIIQKKSSMELVKQKTVEESAPEDTDDEEMQATGMGLTRDHHAFLHLGYNLLERAYIKQLEDNFFFSFKKSKRHVKEADPFLDLLEAKHSNQMVMTRGGSEMTFQRPANLVTGRRNTIMLDSRRQAVSPIHGG